ncbi:MAG: acetolactate synthase-1/2/3 large subunit [Candidatus Poriferisodalaceae bacterium]|jgi:acetolactate synthase-1/2/3 large subunit
MSNEARPVSVEVPVNVWNQVADGFLEQPSRTVPDPDPLALEAAIAAIAGAKRPVIVVGSGAYDASLQVTALAEKLQAPVFTRRQGHGVVDARHPLWVPLAVGHDLWADADVAIGVGTRMEFPILHWGTDDDLQIVQINVDEAELDRHELGAIGVHGDAAEVLDKLLASSAIATLEPASRADDLAERRAAFGNDIAHMEPQLSHLDAIRRALPDNGIIVEDVTQMGFAAQFAFEFRHPRTFLSTGPAGTLGAGVAQAIGAQAAAPDRPVLALVGDGGFLFTATELATAAQYNIPVTILVHDNASYGNVKRMQQDKFGPDRTIASDLVNPDFVAFGDSSGLHTQRADSAEELEPALEAAFAHNGPSLIVSKTGEVPNPWPFMVMPRNRGL